MPVGVGNMVTVPSAISITAPFMNILRLTPSQNFHTGVPIYEICGSWAICIM